MDTWEYGYLYLCQTNRIRVRGPMGYPPVEAGPNLAVIHHRCELSVNDFESSLAVMNQLGIYGWLLSEGVRKDGLPLPVSTANDEIHERGFEVRGYWRHFMRRPRQTG